jgi:hypothetical protein
VRVKPIPDDFERMSCDQLTRLAKQLWEKVVQLETELYDLQERGRRQEYDVRN